MEIGSRTNVLQPRWFVRLATACPLLQTRDQGCAGEAVAAATLMRVYAHQLETLRRLRGGGAQPFQVGHVHINDGAQAVIGAVALAETRNPK
jgi:hypothetical protein